MSTQPFLDHIRTLRGVLVRSVLYISGASLLIFTFFDYFIQIFLILFQSSTTTLAMHTIFEGFSVRVKLAVTGGVILSSPAWGLAVLRFIFPALKRHEKRLIGTALLAGVGLGIGGLYTGYRFILPMSISLLTSVAFIPDSVSVALNYQHSMLYTTQFLAYSVLIFQFPIVLLALLYFGLLTRRGVVRASRYSVIGIVILAALVTPPDIVSQIGLALPLCGLYFLTILIAYIFRLGDA